MSTVYLLCEDKYGVGFFKLLVKRMKENGLLKKNFKLKAKRAPADCNAKFDKLLSAKRLSKDIISVIIIMDKDNTDEKEKIARSHLKENYPIHHKFLFFESEIEELLLLNKDIKYQKHTKPTELLHSKNLYEPRYKKSHLPKLAEKMDLEKIKEHPVIAGFISLWNSLSPN